MVIKYTRRIIIVPVQRTDHERSLEKMAITTEDIIGEIDEFINRKLVTPLTPNEGVSANEAAKQPSILDVILNDMKAQPPPMYKKPRPLIFVNHLQPPVRKNKVKIDKCPQTKDREKLKRKAALKRRNLAKIHGNVPMPLHNHTSCEIERDSMNTDVLFYQN